jgi:DNA-binding LytR/AlgR family response regulator
MKNASTLNPSLQDEALRNAQQSQILAKSLCDTLEQLPAFLFAKIQAHFAAHAQQSPDVLRVLLIVACDGCEHRVITSTIVAVESDNHHVRIHTTDAAADAKNNYYQHRSTLRNWAKRLHGAGIARAHKSWLVALRHCKKVDADFAYVGAAEKKISLSKTYIEKFKAEWRAYWESNWE